MTRQKFLINHRVPRNHLNEVIDLATSIQEQEAILIKKLVLIDNEKYYVWAGYNSLSGFCKFSLRFSKTQSQRLVTQVRRTEPTVNFGIEGDFAGGENDDRTSDGISDGISELISDRVPDQNGDHILDRSNGSSEN